MRQGVLYISYDGMLEPLGKSQVLAYLKRLAKNRCIHLISFEKADDWGDAIARNLTMQDIADAGIIWHPLRYHKRPSALATSWDIACGIILGAWLITRYRLSVVHARSYVPSIIALALKRLTGSKYLFDMRGFWADERVDGGLWLRSSRKFQVAKAFERRFLLAADHVVSLTQAAVREMEHFEYLKGRMPLFTVIPTCVDLARFTPLLRNQAREGFTLGYVGSAGTWYQFDAVAACFAHLLRLRPEARFLILNRGQHAYIRNELSKAKVPDAAFEIVGANHDDVRSHMAQMDAGIFFYRPSFSRVACAPTKLGEFLGCGIPCMSNAGVGDMALVFEGESVGVALQGFDDAALTNGLKALLQLVADSATLARCVSAAQKHFSLDEGVARYSGIYEQLAT
jgi:glycosyltransferase involved in cell wall biosynthesis